MSTTTTTEINPDLEPETLTDKTPTKTLPCRKCGRACIVTQFASPLKTECSACRGANGSVEQQFEFDEELEPEVLTDSDKTKEVPCVECKRRCVVTLFKTPSKTKCLTCRGEDKRQHKQEIQVKAAHTVDPATLKHLADGLINPAFRYVPPCPFDAEHAVELKSISHSPNYGPRRLVGYNAKGRAQYDQDTGESVIYQCNDCHTVISFSTMHPMNLKAQNEPRPSGATGSVLASVLGVRNLEPEAEEAA